MLAVLPLARAMHEESPRFRGLTFDEGQTRRTAEFLMQLDGGFLLVAEHGGTLVGLLAALRTRHFFSAEQYVSELAVYVAPSARGGLLAVRMVRELERWALAGGARECILGVSTEVNVVRTGQLYERLGYRRSGVTYIKDLSSEQPGS